MRTLFIFTLLLTFSGSVFANTDGDSDDIDTKCETFLLNTTPSPEEFALSDQVGKVHYPDGLVTLNQEFPFSNGEQQSKLHLEVEDRPIGKASDQQLHTILKITSDHPEHSGNPVQIDLNALLSNQGYRRKINFPAAKFTEFERGRVQVKPIQVTHASDDPNAYEITALLFAPSFEPTGFSIPVTAVGGYLVKIVLDNEKVRIASFDPLRTTIKNDLITAGGAFAFATSFDRNEDWQANEFERSIIVVGIPSPSLEQHGTFQLMRLMEHGYLTPLSGMHSLNTLTDKQFNNEIRLHKDVAEKSIFLSAANHSDDAAKRYVTRIEFQKSTNGLFDYLEPSSLKQERLDRDTLESIPLLDPRGPNHNGTKLLGALNTKSTADGVWSQFEIFDQLQNTRLWETALEEPIAGESLSISAECKSRACTPPPLAAAMPDGVVYLFSTPPDDSDISHLIAIQAHQDRSSGEWSFVKKVYKSPRGYRIADFNLRERHLIIFLHSLNEQHPSSIVVAYRREAISQP